MTTKHIFCMAVLVPAALAADKGKDNLRAWFQDGTCVEFHSDSTGSTTPSSTSGAVIVDNSNTVHRVVNDGHGNVLFAYDVSARKAPGSQDTFVVQMRPASGIVTGATRTLSAVRDFPAVKRGEAVIVDILQNPATGEKIYDVLRPSDDPLPTGATGIAATLANHDEFVLGDIQIAINGEKFVWAIGATVTAAGARISVPGHGAYFLSVNDAPGFHEFAHANREKITFYLDGEHVEITAKKNVLRQSAYRVVWVKHDPAYGVDTANAKAVDIAGADNVQWLMPKRR